ncbi:hypothetical protein ACEQ8H_008055 [Pleosporales sp. CAS-2024a]
MSNAQAWPPATGLTTKVVARKDAILQLSSATTVGAPAALVFDTVLCVGKYPEWNTWVPSARIQTQPPSSDAQRGPDDLNYMRIGSIMTFDVVMDASKPKKFNHTTLQVLDICTPNAQTRYLTSDMLADPTFTADLSRVYRVSWTGHGGTSSFGMMKLERFHEVLVLNDKECEVRTWELMSGPLSRVVKLLYEQTLEEKLGVWCADLKKYCEKTHAAGLDRSLTV